MLNAALSRIVTAVVLGVAALLATAWWATAGLPKPPRSSLVPALPVVVAPTPAPPFSDRRAPPSTGERDELSCDAIPAPRGDFGAELARVTLGLALALSATAVEVIPTVAEIKALSPEQAAEARPVSLEGVVTVHLGPRSGFFLQDESGGVFVGPKKRAETDIRVGDWISCRGVTRAGQYAPIVELEQWRTLGRKPIPAPVPLALAEFASGRHDAEWVEARGVVHAYRLDADPRPEVQIAVGRERLRVVVREMGGLPPERLVGAEVRVLGAASGYFNQDRQLVTPVLVTPDWSSVVVLQPGPADPFAAELRSSTSLFRYARDERWGRMARLQGTVTHSIPGKAVFLRDADGSIYVETAQTSPLHVGDRVEVAGFPAIGGGAAYLEDSVYRQAGTGAPPAPVLAEPAMIVQGKIRPGDLVSIEGVLVESMRLRDRWGLTLRSGEHTFESHLQLRAGAADVAGPEAGSRLRVTGIVWSDDVDRKGRLILPNSFRLLLREPGDVVTLESASWWTRGRLAQIVVTLLVFVAAALVWIGMLRRRVAAQTSMIAEKVARQAVAEERARTACEIHDTVAQGFMALGFQLEALSSELRDTSPPVRQQLDRTMKMLRHSHEEVRHSLKQMRGQAPEAKGLSVALRETLEGGIANFTPDHFHYAEHGRPFPLPPVTEHNILRIAQEAATNAAKHASARHLDVELRYADDGVHLRIVDDGCGFGATDAPEAWSREHFGLQIMRERAQRIGASFDLRSQPGRGTEVSLFVPRIARERARAVGLTPAIGT